MDALVNDGVIVGTEIPYESDGRIDENRIRRELLLNDSAPVLVVYLTFAFPEIGASENGTVFRNALLADGKAQFLRQFCGIDPARLKKVFFIMISEEVLRAPVQLHPVNYRHEGIVQGILRPGFPIIRRDLEDVEIFQVFVKVAAAAHHKPEGHLVVFVIMVVGFMDDEIDGYRNVELYAHLRPVGNPHVLDLHIFDLKFSEPVYVARFDSGRIRIKVIAYELLRLFPEPATECI